MDNNKVYEDIALSSSILLIIGGVIGVLGNAIILYFYLFRIKERGERYFIPLLAVVDLLGCVISPAYFLVSYLSSTVCQVLYFLQIWIPGISGFTLLLISIQRYLLVCRPFGPRMTQYWKRVSFGIVCFVSLAYSVPLLVTAGVYEENNTIMNQTVTTKVCTYALHPTSSMSAYFIVLCLIVLFNIMLTAGFYIPVLRRINVSLRFSSKKYEIQNEGYSGSNSETIPTSVINNGSLDHEQSGNSQTHAVDLEKNTTVSNSIKQEPPEKTDELQNKKETNGSLNNTSNNYKSAERKREKTYRMESAQRRVTIMFFSIIVVYVLTYIPPLVIMVLLSNFEGKSFETMTPLDFGVRVYLGRIVILNHIVNPLMYGLFDTKFRKKLLHPCQNKS